MKNKNIIQLNNISKTEQESIARTFLPLIEDYFGNPEVQKKFEIWLEKRNKILFGV